LSIEIREIYLMRKAFSDTKSLDFVPIPLILRNFVALSRGARVAVSIFVIRFTNDIVQENDESWGTVP
jgi:hypothetical protein